MSVTARLKLKLAYGLCAMALAVSALYYANYGQEGYSFHGDALGYYFYLPTTFIYHNFKSIEELPADRQIRPFILSCAKGMSANQRSEKGYLIYQYTYGMAAMELPFFLVAHGIELARGSPANGFSETYQTAIGCSTVFYTFLGLWLTFLLLRRYFSKPLSLTVVALLLLGTNLFWFTWQQHGMAHVPLFFLIAALLHLTLLVHQHWRWRHVILLGLVGGMITVIRPVDALVLLFPMLYGVADRGVKAQLFLFWQHRLKVICCGLVFLLPILPQLLLWKWLTGHFHFDSYGAWQTLDLKHPRLIDGLVGGNNGWLVFTPLMVLAVAGLFLLPKKVPAFRTALPLFFGAYVWVIYSWYCYNYINGLGSRPMVDVYAVLALPLAACIDRIKRKLPQLLLTLFVVMAVALNLSYTVQQVKGVLWSEYTSYAFLRSTAFRYHLRYNDLVIWDTGEELPNTAGDVATGPAFLPNLADTAVQARLKTVGNRKEVYVFPGGAEYASLNVKVKVGALPAGTTLVRASTDAFLEEEPFGAWENALLVCAIRRGDSTLLWKGVRLGNKIGTKNGQPLPGTPPLRILEARNHIWGPVSYFIRLPEGLQPNDEIMLDVWNKGKWKMKVANLQLTPFGKSR